MAQPYRLTDIMARARREGAVQVEALAALFGVTVQTIRRDLRLLEQTGELERVHGGAILPPGARNTPYEARRALAHEGKARIAAACAAIIPDGASLCLNIGTTTEAVARALLRHEGLMVVTNNMQVAQIMAGTAQVILTGGTLRGADGGLLGPVAAASLDQFRFDFAIVGCSALDREGEMLDFDMAEVEVSRRILDRARQRIVVADASKFERKAPARIASLREAHALITDAPVPGRVARQCEGWGTRVIIAE